MSQDMVQREETSPQTKPLVLPPVDVYENDDEVVLMADVPGTSKEDVEVRVDGNTLSLRAPQQTTETLHGDFEPVEFYREFTVRDGVDPGSVKAELTRGVLRVSLSKAEAAKPRRIAVQAG